VTERVLNYEKLPHRLGNELPNKKNTAITFLVQARLGNGGIYLA
jgi:hypothetical protein